MAINVNQVKVDQAATFAAMLFLSCEPKREFGKDTQATTKDGRLKWEVQALVGLVDGFGKTNNEVLSVGINSSTNPAEGIKPLTAIAFGDLVCGFMPKAKRNADGSERPLPGISVWFSATEVLNAAETIVRPSQAA